MPGGDAVARFQGGPFGDFGAVEHGAVLAAEVAQSPAVARLALNGQVLAREAVIVRES